MIYIPNQDKLAFYEDGSDEVRFMRPDNGVVDNKILKVKADPLIVEKMEMKRTKDEVKGEMVLDRETKN